MEDFRHLKGQEKSPRNQVGQKKEKKKRGLKKGISNPGRNLKVRGGPHTQENSLMVGKCTGIERDLRGIKGECRRSKENTVDGLWKAGQSKNRVHGLCCSSAHSSLSHESPVVEGG